MTFYVPIWGEGERLHSTAGENEKHSSSTIHQKIKRNGSSVIPPSQPAQSTLTQPKEILTQQTRIFGHIISAAIGFFWLIHHCCFFHFKVLALS